KLDKDAGVRRWLTYFILLIAAIVMIANVIGTITGLLDGELTTKSILKTITVLAIAGTVFVFYLYDVKRERVQGYKDKVISIFTYTSLIVVVVIFVSAWFFVESPQYSRQKKIDQEILNDLQDINFSIRDYYTNHDQVPEDLNFKERSPLASSAWVNPVTDKDYEYEVVADDEYKICTDFLTSNLEDENNKNYYSEIRWHDQGYQCFSQKVTAMYDSKMPPEPVRLK
ncbi:DUF5671 domain-containing protein, partial [bacterium]|nr:DUF5671 domain-containing protein [bacterium]